MRKVIALLVAVMLAACAPLSSAQIIGGGTAVHNHSGNTSGGATLNGTTCASCTLSAPTFSGTTTYGGNLIFSPDGTYDIGASGATRARDFFLSRNALVGGTLGVTGTLSGAAATFTGNFTVAGTGPHAIGGTTSSAIGLYIQGAFNPGAATGYGTAINQTLTGSANQDLYGSYFTGTLNKAGSGTHADFIGSYFATPAIGAGAATLTNATTVKILGAPSVGTNQRALWVAAGLTQLDGTLKITGGAATQALTIPATGRFYLDGGGDTFIEEASANLVSITAGSSVSAQFGSTSILLNQPISAPVTLSLGNALTYGGVTLNNAVTGTGNMVLSSSPTLVTPTLGAATATSINFGGTTLSTYSEGTWTPSLGGNTTYNQQVGTYTKIGRNVCITGALNINAIGTGSTTTISGLPFTNGNTTVTPISVGGFSALATSIVLLHAGVVGSGTTIVFNTLTAAGAASGSAAIFGSSTTLTFAGCYNS